MTEATKEVATAATNPTPTKESIRASIFAAKNKERKAITIEMFGESIEVRQPTIGQITQLSNSDDKTAVLLRILVEYCYVPGTNEKVFTKADVATISELPAGTWLGQFNKALESLTNIDVDTAEKNSETTT